MSEDFSFENEDQPDDVFKNAFGDDAPQRDESDSEEVEVTVAGVYEQRDQLTSKPTAFVVLLRDSTGRSVPIWIDGFQARAISLALEGTEADRPLPYDTFNNIISRIGGKIERILIDDLWNNTYYAKITISYEGKTFDTDSRPSDAIAMGLKAKAPIYMAESVLQKAAVTEE